MNLIPPPVSWYHKAFHAILEPYSITHVTRTRTAQQSTHVRMASIYMLH